MMKKQCMAQYMCHAKQIIKLDTFASVLLHVCLSKNLIYLFLYFSLNNSNDITPSCVILIVTKVDDVSFTFNGKVKHYMYRVYVDTYYEM